MRALWSALLLATLPAPAPATEAGAVPLRLCFEDAPQAPWTMPDGTGLNFDLLHRVEKLTGERFQVVALPWKRCQEETRTGGMDGMVGAADSPERRSFSLPPLAADGTPDQRRALYQDRVNVFLRLGGHSAWNGAELINPSGVAIAQRGYFVADLLRARGQRVIDSIKSAEEGLRLLAAGSADVAVLQGRAARLLVEQDPHYRELIQVAEQPFIRFQFYLMFSRTRQAAEPRRIEAIWDAIAAARADPEYRKLEAAAAAQ